MPAMYEKTKLLRNVRVAFENAQKELKILGPLKVIAAVSGGVDSCVLLRALVELQAEFDLQLSVAHFDHQLRASSKRDADFVRALSEKFALPCDVAAAEKFDGSLNIEAWARSKRYEFLEQVRKKRKAHLVVTAHHSGDQAETMLFRFLTGRLLTDAHGIAALQVEKKLLRPLLNVSKSSIAQFAAEYQLTWVEDETNQDLARTRNKIRHSLLPYLEENYNPNLSENLCALATRLSEDEKELWRIAAALFSGTNEKNNIRFINELSPAIAWRHLSLLALQQVGEAAKKLSYHALDEVLAHVRRFNGEEITLELGFGILCRIDLNAEITFFETAASKSTAAHSLEILSVPGELKRQYANRLLTISSRLIPAQEIAWQDKLLDLDSSAQVAYFDFDDLQRGFSGLYSFSGLGVLPASPGLPAKSVPGNSAPDNSLPEPTLCIRARSDGDVVEVWKRGRRKLKKLLQESRLTLTLRDQIPIVECGGNIIWVPGVARSRFAPVKPESSVILELSYHIAP